VSTAEARARDAAQRAVAVCTVLANLVGEDEQAFLTDTRSQWAAGMGLIRIGEAVNRIPAEVLARFDGQPWREIVALRNLAAHQYEDLQPRRVWRTVSRDVPALRAYLVGTVLPALGGPRHEPAAGP
jgi:uncharacterized protein with HEPN domain